MTIETKDELIQLIEDIQSRLSVIETDQKKPKEEEKEPKENNTQETTEVESDDEIEKLLNS